MEYQIKHKIGLVFDGGGGKGAYQIGVWKALSETGLDRYVTDIAGTSAGGLNAALFVKGNLEEAEKIWTEELSTIKTAEIAMGVSNLIDKHLSDMSIFDNTSINCFLTTTNINGRNAGESYDITPNGKRIKHCVAGKAEYFNLRFLDKEDRKESLQNATMRKSVLLATSALPVLCHSLKINGNRYRDGGVSDNSPVHPLLLATKCDTIIVVHLKTETGLYKNNSGYDDVAVFEIVPSGDTGGFFNGTIDFDTEHAKKLMTMGYNDAIEPLKTLVKNWVKEYFQSNSGKRLFHVVEQLSPEEKYRLYNECEFLVRGNYGKVKYITEDGIGKTFWRVITGQHHKVKKQILENTQFLQEKMLAILVSLDDGMLNLKGKVNFLFYNEMCLGDRLLESHQIVMKVTKILNGLIERNDYVDNFLKEKYPDFQKGNTADLKILLEEIKNDIKRNIKEINEQNQKAWEHQQAETAKRKKLVSAAKEHRILRITPERAFVISYDFITDEQIDGSGNSHRSSKVGSKIIETKLSERNCDILVLPEDNKHSAIKSIKTIRPSEYYMFLWFVNTPKQERKDKFVCMIDYYKGDMRVYGYKVNEDGSDYNPIPAAKNDNRISYTFAKDYLLKHISDILGNNKSFQFYRTFETSHKHFEKKLNEQKYIDIKVVDPDWEKVLTENDGELFAELIDRLAGRIYE